MAQVGIRTGGRLGTTAEDWGRPRWAEELGEVRLTGRETGGRQKQN